MEREYYNVELLNRESKKMKGFTVIFGNMVRRFDGMEWEDLRVPDDEDILVDELPIIYGWIKPDDWVRIVRPGYEIAEKRTARVTETFIDKIEVVDNQVKYYLPYYAVELSKHKNQKHVLKATKVANKKTGTTFYQVKE